MQTPQLWFAMNLNRARVPEMTKPKQLTFNEYRYQLLPISQHELQLTFNNKIKTLDDLKLFKNSIFEDVLTSITTFLYSRTQIEHKKLWMKDNIFIIQLGVERDLTRTTRDFKQESVDNWPTTLVAFNNDPYIQKCLVQKSGGFAHTATVVRFIEDNIRRNLLKYQLSIAFEPIYKQEYFWNLVSKYENKITQIDFELISPNMSNISASLKVDLRELNATTNTHRTHLQLNSDDDSHLTPSSSDTMIDSLVKYSSDGGGDITIKVKGLNRKLHTAKGIIETSVDELSITSASPEKLQYIFRDLLR